MKQATGTGGRRRRGRPRNATDATKPKKPSKPPKKQPRAGTRQQPAKARPGKPVKSAKSKKAAKPAKSVAKAAAGSVASRFEVRELDPVRKCGPDTSVQQLYRVDEHTNGQARAHLVFFDRHGWYCEHGRDCPAVAPARKAGIHAHHTGPTHNGRTRA